MGYHTELDGCGRFMKYILFFINFIIFLAGLAITIISIIALVYKVNYISVLTSNDGQSSNLHGAVYVLLIAGIVTTIVSFFGCYGAMREVKCMLLMYALILLCLTVVIAVAAILGIVYRASFKEKLVVNMENSMNLYSRQQSVREAWDAVQANLRCCGVHNHNDWARRGFTTVPRSCCQVDADGITVRECNRYSDSINSNNAYIRGCSQATREFLETHSGVLIGIGFSGAVLTFIGLVFSIALFRRIH
ncbi:CD82 antigen [Phymastichus coffea]|uniref:CD82 antigen n=1 Tax=Phymastichus coffea TaxID=108790 RepID=UPI00273A9037|nr:CD82 antigen [Phymastichus coffea]XP_058796420.1 CD82 antigen [Phymastichus coffea]